MISLTRLVVSLSLLLASAPAIQAAGGKGNAPRGLRLRGMQPIEVQARRGGGWGWWGRDKAINITISADGPLVECSDVRLDWASDLIPKGRAVTYHIQADPTWPDAKGRHSVLPPQDFVTPSTSHSWKVDYPAGTVIEFFLSPWRMGRGVQNIYGESLNFTVQPGTTQDCIPADHFPIITTVPPKLIECEPAVFTWEGGEGPFEAYVVGKLPNSWHWDSIRNVGNGSLAWVVDYPVGTNVEVSIFQAGGGFAQSGIELVVAEKGRSSSCIPADHLPQKRRWFRHPAAITGFVLGGILVAAILGYAGYRGYLTYQANKRGAIQLEE